MTFEPILQAPLAVQLHLAAVAPALILGPAALARRRRDGLHRALGYGAVLALAAAAVTGLFISTAPVLGPFGPIHLLSVLTLWGLWQAVRAARARRIAEHSATMREIMLGAMGIAGALSLLPGRTMQEALLPGRAGLALQLALGLAAGFGAAMIWPWLRRRFAIGNAAAGR